MFKNIAHLFSQPKTVDSVLQGIQSSIQTLQDLAMQHTQKMAAAEERKDEIEAERLEIISQLNQKIADVNTNTEVVKTSIDGIIGQEQFNAERAASLAAAFSAQLEGK